MPESTESSSQITGDKSELNGTCCSPIVWHHLQSLRSESRLEEIMAAACDDGVGVIARWTRREDGSWDVESMDTESDGGMKKIVCWEEGEIVPTSPPSIIF